MTYFGRETNKNHLNKKEVIWKFGNIESLSTTLKK